MQRYKVDLQQAYVLHARQYRETSLLVELFTSSHGRVGVVARGARSRKSSYRAVLQPFSLLCVSWVAGGELGTLTGAELTGRPQSLHGRGLACGFYVNELLMRLLIRHDPHPHLFQCYGETLRGVANSTEQAQVLRTFEKRLLEELGYGLVLDRDVSNGEPIQPDIRYRYLPEEGPVAVDSSVDLGQSISGGTLLAMGEEVLLNEEQLREARRLLQQTLHRYLGDRPLKSRELVRAYRQSGGT